MRSQTSLSASGWRWALRSKGFDRIYLIAPTRRRRLRPGYRRGRLFRGT
jgi:hypothetical protein